MSCGPHKIRQIVPNCPEKLVHLPSLHIAVIKDLYKLYEGIALTLTVIICLLVRNAMSCGPHKISIAMPPSVTMGKIWELADQFGSFLPQKVGQKSPP